MVPLRGSKRFRKPDVHHGVRHQVFVLVLVVKVQLEKRSSESDKPVVDPGTDRILVGIFDWDYELIVAIELDEDGKDVEPVVHDGVVDGSVMTQAKGQLHLRRTFVGKRNQEYGGFAVKPPHVEALSCELYALFDVLEDVHVHERLKSWQQD